MSTFKKFTIALFVIICAAQAFALELPQEVDQGYNLNLSGALETTISTFNTALLLLFFLLIISAAVNIFMFFALNKSQNQVKEALLTIKEINSFKDVILQYLRKVHEGDSTFVLPDFSSDGLEEDIEVLQSQRVEGL
jgi:hypothetical protein